MPIRLIRLKTHAVFFLALLIAGTSVQAQQTLADPPTLYKIARQNPAATRIKSRLPNTGQGSCFDDHVSIVCPAKGQPFFGQDANYSSSPLNYRNYRDGTLQDMVTGLVWQQSMNPLPANWQAAQKACANLRQGPYRDWRLPSARELFSLLDLSGAYGVQAYIDASFEWRPAEKEALPMDALITGQMWTATTVQGTADAAYKIDFQHGLISTQPTQSNLYFRCVRGREWGNPTPVGNANGTVSERQSGLMWQAADDGVLRSWSEALVHCVTARTGGYDDWRVPNVRELVSVIDFTPEGQNSTSIFQTRPGTYWSSTTHGDNARQALSICMGQCNLGDKTEPLINGTVHSEAKWIEPVRAKRGVVADETRGKHLTRCVRSE